MVYVIACGDEGVQLNQGVRLGFAGSGLKLAGFSQVVKILKKLFKDKIAVVATEENDWIREKLGLNNWEQVTASSQQHVEALADREGLLYSGFVPFADPQELAHGVKAHMVRPKGIHIANKICFTLGGGENKFNLGNYVISADWVHMADIEVVKSMILPQLDFYKKLAGDDAKIVFDYNGELGIDIAKKNAEVLKKLKISESVEIA